MYTFNNMWGVITPEQAQAEIDRQRSEIKGEPRNLEEQAISLVGRDIYEKLIKGYTEKQWGRACTELPSFIIRRLPFRLTFDNNYFNALYQGIPVGGYTKMVENMLSPPAVMLAFSKNSRIMAGSSQKCVGKTMPKISPFFKAILLSQSSTETAVSPDRRRDLFGDIFAVARSAEIEYHPLTSSSTCIISILPFYLKEHKGIKCQIKRTILLTNVIIYDNKDNASVISRCCAIITQIIDRIDVDSMLKTSKNSFRKSLRKLFV